MEYFSAIRTRSGANHAERPADNLSPPRRSACESRSLSTCDGSMGLAWVAPGLNVLRSEAHCALRNLAARCEARHIQSQTSCVEFRGRSSVPEGSPIES